MEGLGSGLRLGSGYLTLNPNPDQVRLYFIEGQAAAAMGRHQKDSKPNPTPNPKPNPNPNPSPNPTLTPTLTPNPNP